jgi:hypothetical protein
MFGLTQSLFVFFTGEWGATAAPAFLVHRFPVRGVVHNYRGQRAVQRPNKRATPYRGSFDCALARHELGSTLPTAVDRPQEFLPTLCAMNGHQLRIFVNGMKNPVKRPANNFQT